MPVMHNEFTQHMRRRGQKCPILGCAKWGGEECTDDMRTCRMLARMRESNVDSGIKAMGRRGK